MFQLEDNLEAIGGTAMSERFNDQRMTAVSQAAALRRKGQIAATYGAVGEDSVLAALARAGRKVDLMERIQVFDTRAITIDAAGGLNGPIQFFQTARSQQHPLGVNATNMEGDGRVPVNKELLLKDLGFTVQFSPETVGAATQAQIDAFWFNMAQFFLLANVTTVDEFDRGIIRGTLCMMPSGYQAKFDSPIYQNPAAVALYRQSSPGYKSARTIERFRISPEWWVGAGQNFSIRLDFPVVNVGAVFAAQNVIIQADMSATRFTTGG